MSTATGFRVPIDDLAAFSTAALKAGGASDEHARIVTDVLVTTDTCGTFTHGTKLLAGYIRRLQAGGLVTDADPEVVSEGPAWAIVDGNSVLGHVTGQFAMHKAIDLAKGTGLAYVGVRNSCHFGAAGFYSSMAARKGLIGISMANDIPSVCAPGSRTAVTGTNPFSFAVPNGDDDPIMLDMAISTVAGGKVYAACQRGEPIPDNWIIDRNGQPTTDSSLYPADAALAPMANHKGYGIALLIETLSGLLTGAAFTWGVKAWIQDDPAAPTHHGGAFLAIDVDAIMPSNEFEQRVRSLIDEIHNTPTADGIDQVFLPGDMEWARRHEAVENGIPLPDDVVQALRQVASDTGIEANWLPA